MKQVIMVMTMIECTVRCISRLRLTNFSDVPGGQDQVGPEMHLEAIIVYT